METTPTTEPTQSAQDAVAVSSAEARLHFIRNTVANVVFFLFNAGSSLVMVPYQLVHLGDANYGMVLVANSFIAYTQVLTVVLIVTLYRFVTLHLARKEMAEAQSYFSTQLVALLWFTGIFLPLGMCVSYLTPYFLRIPPGQEWNTRMLFALMYGSFFITLLTNPFRLAQFARQRFDIGNWINIGGQVVRYSSWIILFGMMTPSIWHIGIGFILEAAFGIIAAWIVFARLLPGIRLTLKGFDKDKLIEVAKMGGWMMVNQVGVMLYLFVDALIINLMIGPASVGRYGTILGVAIMLRGLSSTMSGMITPLAVAAYANHDIEAMKRQMVRAVKFVSLGMAVPFGAICGLAHPFLARWLGPQFAYLYPLVWWLLAHQVVTCGVEPLYSINMAANKMAVPGISTIIGGVLKLALSIILVKYTSMGFYGVAAAGLVAFVAKNVLFTPWYAAHTLKIPSRPFYTALLPSVLAFGVVAASGLFVAHTFALSTKISLAATFLAMFAIFYTLVYAAALSSDDRAFVKGLLPWAKKAA